MAPFLQTYQKILPAGTMLHLRQKPQKVTIVGPEGTSCPHKIGLSDDPAAVLLLYASAFFNLNSKDHELWLPESDRPARGKKP